MHVFIEIWLASEYSEVQVIHIIVEGVKYFDSPQAICIGIALVNLKSFMIHYIFYELLILGYARFLF